MDQLGFDTIIPADCIEFCPHAEAQEYFVCGTYKLHQHSDTTTDSSNSDDNETSVGSTVSGSTPQKRTGKCLLFNVNTSNHADLYVPDFNAKEKFDLNDLAAVVH